jgi:hypothetical protein
MSKTRSNTVFTTALALVLTLAAGSALAGTTGTEFQTMYTTLLADSSTGRRGVRTVHGLRADHHRHHHDRSHLSTLDDRRHD